MKLLLKMGLCTLMLAGCTTTPDKYRKNPSSSVLRSTQNVASQSVNNGAPSAASLQGSTGKMQALATADIGVPDIFIDTESGMTTELIVLSEYFSASGRICRRFIEIKNGQEHNGIGCEDAQYGWVELPLATYLR